MDIHDSEFQALLSAYAMGTLTDDERTRLFAKALDNQALFDALMDEQSLKDALDHPLVRRALLRAIEEIRQEQPDFAAASALAPVQSAPAGVIPPKPPRLLWAAVASALSLSFLAVFLLRPVAQKKAEPDLYALKTNPPAVAPVQQPAPPASVQAPAPKRAVSKEALSETPKSVPAAPAAEAEIAERKEERPAPPMANSFSAPAADSLESRARQATAVPLTAAQIYRDTGQLFLRVSAPSPGFLYAFAEDGPGWLPISAPGANIWRAGEQRSFPLGPLASGTEIRYLFTAARDEQLEQALENPRFFPQRQWSSLRVPR